MTTLSAVKNDFTPNHRADHLKAIAALVAAVLFLSTGPIVTVFADVGPSASAFYRIFMAMPMTWLMLALIRGTRKKSVPEAKLVPSGFAKLGLILCGVFFAGDIGFLHYAYTHGSVGVATFLNNLSPFCVVLGSWIVFGAKPSRLTLLSLSLVIPGALLLSGVIGASSSDDLSGLIAALLSAVCFGGFILTTTQIRRYYSSHRIMGWTNAISCSILAPVAILMGEVLIPAGWQGWAVLALLALLSQVLGMEFLTRAMGSLSAQVTSISILGQPVLAAFLAWWILEDTLSLMQVVGATIIILAIAMNNLPRRSSLAPA